MSTSCNSGTFAHLQQIFPGQVVVDTRQAASALNIAFKTLNNAGSAFPISPVRIGRRKYFRLIDIAAFLDMSLGISEPAPLQQDAISHPTPMLKRGRGRPCKEQNAPEVVRRGG